MRTDGWKIYAFSAHEPGNTVLSVQQAINRLVCCELPAIEDRVLETNAWTDEEVGARKQLFAMFRKLRRLAVKTQNEIVVEGVEKLIGTFKADPPNLRVGGGVN